MEESILKSVKAALDVPADYTVFDDRLIMHINSVFSDLDQIGVGPDGGYEIAADTEVWADFLVDPILNSVRTYMVLRCRLEFDPPVNSFTITSMERRIEKMERRMKDAAGLQPVAEDIILEGGSP